MTQDKTDYVPAPKEETKWKLNWFLDTETS